MLLQPQRGYPRSIMASFCANLITYIFALLNLIDRNAVPGTSIEFCRPFWCAALGHWDACGCSILFTLCTKCECATLNVCTESDSKHTALYTDNDDDDDDIR